MKNKIGYCILIMSFHCSTLLGQHTFKINSNIQDSVNIKINNQYYNINHFYSTLATNFPDFDTLQFLDEQAGSLNPILCNFKPDSSYSLTYACCGSLDIIPSYKLEHDSLAYWDFEKDHFKIQNLLMDRPTFYMQLSEEPTDSIYAWYSDLSCFPTLIKVGQDETHYGFAEKCFYWNNISPIIFFKSKVDYYSLRSEDGKIRDIYPEFEDIEILGQINLRLFDNDAYLITLDAHSQHWTLKPKKGKNNTGK